ncbi:MAG TPA: PP2C family protein-serine/threonine phosphatase, partial [Planctomycetaceae bacterium]|nr:PP2C family protein-serine/threonine phosphatase [Planctomycetaceae bacterium]
GSSGLPLGIIQHARYDESVLTVQPGDQLVFYTDGITEAHNARGELFGVERLDAELQTCGLHAGALMDSVLAAVERFADGRAADDDRTLIVARVVE